MWNRHEFSLNNNIIWILPLKTSYDIVTQVIAIVIYPFAVPPGLLIIMITFAVIALILMSYWKLQGKSFVSLKENLFIPFCTYVQWKDYSVLPATYLISLYIKAVPHSLISGFFRLLLNKSSWFHLNWKSSKFLWHFSCLRAFRE